MSEGQLQLKVCTFLGQFSRLAGGLTCHMSEALLLAIQASMARACTPDGK